jgi:RNA polymerase sigma factor (sigma-70 family)
MTANLGQTVRQLCRLLESEALAEASDAQLLQRFADLREERAFAILVERHGPLVLGVCRRVLRRVHDAEDAFQATFLVLARRAQAIRKPEALACWLHGVAFRVARKMKAGADKRRQREQQAPVAAAVPPADLSSLELHSVIDEELQHLPEQHRQPLVLCCLNGLTQHQAADQLGWPRGTLKRRLERGRQLLKRGLTLRGLTLAAGLVAAQTADEAVAIPVAVQLAAATSRAAVLFATRQPFPAGLLSVRVIALAEGVLQSMLTTKLKSLVAILLTLGLVTFGGWILAQNTPARADAEDGSPAARAEDSPPAVHAQAPALPAQQPPRKEPSDLEKLQGIWHIVRWTYNRKEISFDKSSVPKFVFRENAFLDHFRGHEELKGTITLTTDATPRRIDWLRAGTSGSAKGLRIFGIYKLEGKQLWLCWGDFDGQRPSEFQEVMQQSLPSNISTVQYVLERDEPAAPPEPQKDQPRPEQPNRSDNVKVERHEPGEIHFALVVTDSGLRVQQDELDWTVVLPEQTPGATSWQRVVQASPGYTLADVKLGEIHGARVKNLQAVVSLDRKEVTLTGDWDSSGQAAQASGTATLDLKLVRETATAVRLPQQKVSTTCGGWGAFAQARLALPPPPKGLRQLKRKIDVEIRMTVDEEGRSQLLLSAPDIRLPWGSESLPLGARGYCMAFGASQEDDHILVRWVHLFP